MYQSRAENDLIPLSLSLSLGKPVALTTGYQQDMRYWPEIRRSNFSIFSTERSEGLGRCSFSRARGTG